MGSPTRAPAVDVALSAQCLYVYGIVDSSIDPGMLIGAARGTELELTVVGAVAAVHCQIDASEVVDLEPELVEGSRFAHLVRRHDEVVTALALAGPVLPVRFGTLISDCDKLTETLAKGEQDLQRALDRVRGCAEWQLHVTVPATDEFDPRPPSEGRSEGAGTLYLLGKRNARRRADARRAETGETVRALDASLSLLAQETAAAAGSGTAANTSYLVANAAQQDFLAIAAEGAAALERLGCTAALRGPLAAYSFADVRLGEHDG